MFISFGHDAGVFSGFCLFWFGFGFWCSVGWFFLFVWFGFFFLSPRKRRGKTFGLLFIAVVV